jgi:hypothetical protein
MHCQYHALVVTMAKNFFEELLLRNPVSMTLGFFLHSTFDASLSKNRFPSVEIRIENKP